MSNFKYSGYKGIHELKEKYDLINNYKASKLYDKLQLKQIELGLLSDLDVSIYDKPDIPGNVMMQLRVALQAGLDFSQYYPALSASELKQKRVQLLGS